jgi:hypothetical protein
MITALSNAFSSQPNSYTDTDCLTSQRFVDFDLDRSRASRRRQRVLSSAREVVALFHHDIEDRASLQ